jgi:hypothetical protein
MDESGFTGEDLLSPDQPIFVHVSTTLSDEESAALYKEYFSGTQGAELKHKNLSKRSRGQDRIVGFFNAVEGTEKCTVWLCHKEFTLLTYLVDLWVEPAMRQDGIDLYRDGANLGLCNMTYFCLRTFQSEQYLTRHLQRFQRMMIRRTRRSYREFWEELYRNYHCTDERTKDILVFFLGGEMKLGYEQLREIPKRALDPAFTTALETCAHWRKHTDASLRLVHDKSSSLAKDRWLWELITSPDLEQRTIGVPGRETVYPLNVAQTGFADSRSHLQLQFCDLIAGATAAWCRQFIDLSYDKKYVELLGKAGIENLRIGMIWPQAEVDPEKLGMKGWSGEGVDFLAEQLAKLAEN